MCISNYNIKFLQPVRMYKLAAPLIMALMSAFRPFRTLAAMQATFERRDDGQRSARRQIRNYSDDQ